MQKRKKQSKTCFTFFLACTFDMPLFCDKSQDAVKNQIPEKFTSQLLGQDWIFYHKTPGRFGLIIFSGCPQVFWGIFKTQGPYNVKTVFNRYFGNGRSNQKISKNKVLLFSNFG